MIFMAHNYYQGKYTVLHPEKYVGDSKDVVFRSLWERKFMVWCDTNPSVLKWGSEIYPIQYYSEVDQKVRRYFIDFFVQIKKADGTIQNLAIEIKPYSQTQMPVRGRKKEKTYIQECLTYQVNQDKWKAAREWAKKNGFEFIILTEYELGLAKRNEKGNNRG
jgi:hypothetical protein